MIKLYEKKKHVDCCCLLLKKCHRFYADFSLTFFQFPPLQWSVCSNQSVCKMFQHLSCLEDKPRSSKVSKPSTYLIYMYVQNMDRHASAPFSLWSGSGGVSLHVQKWTHLWPDCPTSQQRLMYTERSERNPLMSLSSSQLKEWVSRQKKEPRNKPTNAKAVHFVR